MPGYNLDWDNDDVGRREYKKWRQRKEDSEWDGSPPPPENQKHERRREFDRKWGQE